MTTTLAKPDIDPEPKGTLEQVLLGVLVVVPFLALLAAVPLAWGWGSATPSATRPSRCATSPATCGGWPS